MDATLQIKRNGGSAQTGGVRGASGDSVQLTAADKTAWPTATPARWNIFCYTAGITCPAGWSTDTDDALAPTFFFVGNGDPPAFTAAPGTYDLQLLVTGLPVDERTSLKVASARGTYRIGRREGAQFGGAKRRWIADINASLDAIDARGPLPPVDCWLDAQNSTGQASDANPGTQAKPWLTMRKADEGFFALAANFPIDQPAFLGSGFSGTLHLLSNVDGFLSIDCPASQDTCALAVDGMSARTAGASGTLTAVSLANPTGGTVTTVAAGSNNATLPQGTIFLASTTGIPASGTGFLFANAGPQAIAWTGKTSGSLTGVTGGTAPIQTGVVFVFIPSTTIAVASNGLSLPQASIHLTDSTLFVSGAPAGVALVTTSNGPQTVNYTSNVGNVLGGCTGGTGAMTTGAAVSQGPNEYRVYASGFDWSSHVNQYAEVTSGANAGVGFIVMHDLGSGHAIISQPNQALSYGFTGTFNVSPGDPFAFFSLVKFGDEIECTGRGSLSMQMVKIGDTATGGIFAKDGVIVYCDSVIGGTIEAGFPGMIGSAYVAGCYFGDPANGFSGMFAYSASFVTTWAGGTKFAQTHYNGIIDADNLTIVVGGYGAQAVECHDLGQFIVEEFGWLAASHCGVALNLEASCRFFTKTHGAMFGTSLTGETIYGTPGVVALVGSAAVVTYSSYFPNFNGFAVPTWLLSTVLKQQGALPYNGLDAFGAMVVPG